MKSLTGQEAGLRETLQSIYDLARTEDPQSALSRCIADRAYRALSPADVARDAAGAPARTLREQIEYLARAAETASINPMMSMRSQVFEEGKAAGLFLALHLLVGGARPQRMTTEKDE